MKNTPHKWLNLERLCQLSFPGDEVHRIRYFTARVKARPSDPQQPIRQAVYLRALGTLSCVTIHYGHYFQTTVNMPFAAPSPGGPATARVIKSEEKGSDVNLATMLLLDAFEGDFDQAVVISNDSDLTLPIQLVQERLGLRVVVLFPCGKGRKPSYHLSKVAAASPLISRTHLAAAQFPQVLTDGVGTFHKPPSW